MTGKLLDTLSFPATLPLLHWLLSHAALLYNYVRPAVPMLWLQVFNTFCDVAQFLLQSPQLPFYDYFGRALPPCRAKALMQKQFPEVFTSPRTCRKTVKKRGSEREEEREHARSSQWKRIASTLDSIREPIRLRLCGSSCVGVSVVPL